MAEINYKREPTVSVHGVPQSEYQGSGEYGGGGAGGFLKQHWVTIAVGIGAVILGYILYKNYSSGSSGTGADTNSSSGSAADWGSQLDADIQQMMSFQNEEVGLLQQLLNTTPATKPPSPTPQPTKPPKPKPTKPPKKKRFPVPPVNKNKKILNTPSQSVSPPRVGLLKSTGVPGQHIMTIPGQKPMPLRRGASPNIPMLVGPYYHDQGGSDYTYQDSMFHV